MTKKIDSDLLSDMPSFLKVENKLEKLSIISNEFIEKDKRIYSFYGNFVENTELDNSIEVYIFFFLFSN
jgi:hypothetical protein